MTGVAPAGGAPATYDGWARLAEAVAAQMPVAAIDAIWTFAKVRHETREFGTAIVSRVDGDRRRIYTARFALTIRGSERGAFQATIEEVGSGPLHALEELVADVRKRSDDGEPPEPVAVAQWYPEAALAAAAAEGTAVEEPGAPADAPTGGEPDGAAQS